MPIGGKLLLKGGVSLKGSVKKSKHKKSKALQPAEGDEGEEQQHNQQEQEQADGALQPTKKIDPTAINVMSGKSYEQEFEFEQQRMKAPKVRSTPWGSTYREAPEILHGYTDKVKGNTPSERLDMRAATKADKFCK